MSTIRRCFVHVIIVGLAANLPAWPLAAHGVSIDPTDIAGVVTGPNGPDAGGCWSCHQLGSKGTREIPAALGSFPSSVAAWQRRLQSGQAGAQMMGTVSQLGAQRAFAMFADWTDRIAAGEVPPTPPRPQGVERQVVITEWDWADPKAYLHDEVSTDRRDPTINAHGSLYGSLELSADYLPVLDPARNAAGRVPLTVRDPNTAPAAGSQMLQPSAY